jgi:hypothetical protein
VEKTTLYLPAELQRSLAATARRERRSQADIIRSAIEAYVAGRAPLPRSTGAGSDQGLSGAASEEWLRTNWKAGAVKRGKSAK